jgi:ATP-dependent Lhr-like helicase
MRINFHRKNGQKKVSSTHSLHESSTSSVHWFESMGWKPAAFQLESWIAQDSGEHGLINAPTGSGKTYAALMPIIARYSQEQKKIKGLRLLWITPIRALAVEIEKSANRAIQGMKSGLSTDIRTGDTAYSKRTKQLKSLPNILITTPESLHLMLCSRNAHEIFSQVEVIVADEWHELMGTKRGVQVELALSRLKSLSPELQIWGISATIGNLPEAMECLLGPDTPGRLIRSETRKEYEVISILPEKAEKMPWAGHLGIRLAKNLLPIIHQSTSTLIFTNVRSQCEIWYRTLLELDPSLAGVMAMHHGSISKEIRAWVEEALYEGRLKAVICTSSLDLGVDFAPVETIIQIGGPKGVARFVQRAGRSGHRPDAKSKIYFLPTHSLELIEAAALRQAIEDNYLESKPPLTLCFDVLIQYIISLACGEGFESEPTFRQVKATYCYADLTNDEWNWVVQFASVGGNSLGSYTEYSKIVLQDGLYKVEQPSIANRHRMSIGTIVSDTLMLVKLRKGGMLGHVEESFISQLEEGDHFWFAGLSLQLLKVKDMTALVRKSEASEGRTPVWLGGRLPLSSQMSVMLRKQLHQAECDHDNAIYPHPELSFIQPILELQRLRSHVPLTHELLIEIFETPEGYHHLFYPFEGRSVHEGIASLLAYRIGQKKSISFSLAYNDYGFELLSDQRLQLSDFIASGLFSTDSLETDILAGINAGEMAKRKFRDIAAIAGLVFKGYPGQKIRDRHLQNSSQLIYQVFESYEPDNLLLRQAIDEVVHQQLEYTRTREALNRMQQQKIILRSPEKPTPLAFPILVDRLREQMSSEALIQRIEKMTLEWSD